MSRRKMLLPSLAVVALVASGCSSNDSGDSGGSGGTGSDGAVSAEGSARAQEATEKALQAPTTIPLTEPLPSAPESGNTFVYMKCEFTQCQTQADAIKDATDAIGWRYEEIPFTTYEPATLVDGLRRALDRNPAGVALSTAPRETWESVVPAYRAAGVPIVTNFSGASLQYDDVVIGQASGVDTETWARTLANWAIADSEGRANVLVQTLDGAGSTQDFAAAYIAELEKNCPTCSATTVQVTGPQLAAGQVASTLVAALHREPDLNYIAASNGAFTNGLVPALAAAGLADRVRISGTGPSTTNLTNIKAGTEHAFTAIATEYVGWSMLDILLRHLQDVPFEQYGNQGMPTQLLTRDVDFEVTEFYDQPADWREQIKELWRVG